MFSDERMKEIIQNAKNLTKFADNSQEVPSGNYISRHELRDLTVLSMFLADYYQITKNKEIDHE